MPRNCRPSAVGSRFRLEVQKESRNKSRWQKQAEVWERNSPKFKLDVSLEELERRPRSQREVDKARQKVTEMKNMPSDAKSGLFYDRHGTLLVAYCAFLDAVPSSFHSFHFLVLTQC